MIRSASIQIANLVKTITGFTNDNVFENEKIPESFIKSQTLPFIYIQSLDEGDSIYASGKRIGEWVSAQVDVYTASNRDQERYHNLIESLLSSQGFGCFFIYRTYQMDTGFKLLQLRFEKYQNLRIG